MKKILFLLHGGTISQVYKDNGDGHKYLAPAKDSKLFLESCKGIINQFKKELKVTCEFVTAKDSTNIQPNDWTNLANRIKAAQNEEGYDGVIVTHGTDTLAYTAAAVAFALHGGNPNGSSLNIPVCITGSQKNIYLEETDAHHNLFYAFKTILQASEQGIADVLVNFGQKVMLGARVIKVSETDYEAFSSPNFPNVGLIKDQKLLLNKNLVSTQNRFLSSKTQQVKFDPSVLSIDLTPGLKGEMLLSIIKNTDLKALILRSFAAGNLPFEGEGSLSQAVEYAVKEKKIPVFLTSKVPAANASASEYEAGINALKSGAIPCYDQTEAVVSTKIAWLLGNDLCRTVEDFELAMRTNYVGELVPPKEVI